MNSAERKAKVGEYMHMTENRVLTYVRAFGYSCSVKEVVQETTDFLIEL